MGVSYSVKGGERNPVLVNQYQLAYKKYLKPLLRISSIPIPLFLFFFAIFGSINSEFQLSLLFFAAIASIAFLTYACIGKYLFVALAALSSFFILINLDDGIRKQESTDFCIKLILNECPSGTNSLRECPSTARDKIKQFHCLDAFGLKNS